MEATMKPTIWVDNDLEADDVICHGMIQADYYAVGEGEANIKYNRMLEYCKALGINAVVIQGTGSDAKFPLDGTEFDGLSQLPCTEDYMTRFAEFSAKPFPVMFALKPMRELVAALETDQNVIALVSKVTLYVYGGFNFRCIKRKDLLLTLLSHFKSVHIYETFFSCKTSSMNKTNAPRLYKYIQETVSPYMRALRRLMINWNSHMLSTGELLLESDVDLKVKERAARVVENISGHEDFQAVLADFALVAVHADVPAVPICNLRFVGGYTKFDIATEPTNLHAYIDIPFQTVIDLVERYFCK